VYEDAVAAINASTTPTDAVTAANNAVSAMAAVSTAAAAALQTNKTSALANLATAYGQYSASDYSAENWAKLKKAYDDAVSAINAAQTSDVIVTAVTGAATAMAAVAKTATTTGSDLGSSSTGTGLTGSSGATGSGLTSLASGAGLSGSGSTGANLSGKSAAEVAKIKESIAAANDIVSGIEYLINKSSRSTEEKKLLQSYVASLNSILPELKLVYDVDTDKLNMKPDDIRKYIKGFEPAEDDATADLTSSTTKLGAGETPLAATPEVIGQDLNQEVGTSWIASHIVLFIIILLVVIAAAAFLLWRWLKRRGERISDDGDFYSDDDQKPFVV
jgi:hypothetical protein